MGGNLVQLVLLALVAVNAIVLVVILRLGRGHEPSCGGCGADLAVADSLACPACGADLREVGVLSRQMTRMAPAWLLGLLAGVVLSTVVPPLVVATHHLVERFNAPRRVSTELATYSGLLDVGRNPWVTLVLDEETIGATPVAADGSPRLFAVELALRSTPAGGERGTIRLVVDGVERGAAYAFDITGGTVGTDETAVEAWLATTGLRSGTPEQRDVLAAIATMVLDGLRRRANGSGGHRAAYPLGSISVVRSSEEHFARPWLPAVFWSSWTLLWLTGLLLVALWTRRRARRVSSTLAGHERSD